MKNEIYFNFYGFKVEIVTTNSQLKQKLKVDFHYFLVDKKLSEIKLQIKTDLTDNLKELIPKNLIAVKQSINSVTYDEKNIRFNDYYGQAVTILNKKTNTCHIYAREIEFMHELVYLVVLSRQGKWHDFHGLHKIHAMGISKKDKNLVVMMPMKGGKTTLFTSFLSDPEIGLISDDTPMTNMRGEIKPFPIRFGVENKDMYQEMLNDIDEQYKSYLDRKQYGLKILVDLTYWKQRCGRVGTKNILIDAVRINSDQGYVKKIGSIAILRSLVKNMVVGIGLPMVIEYFLESTLKDKLIHSRILIYRSISAFMLAVKSKKYRVYLGQDLDKNKKIVMDLLN